MNIIDTTRCYPRTLRAAFPQDDAVSAFGIEGPIVIRTYRPWWLRILQLIREVRHHA